MLTRPEVTAAGAAVAMGRDVDESRATEDDASDFSIILPAE